MAQIISSHRRVIKVVFRQENQLLVIQTIHEILGIEEVMNLACIGSYFPL